MIFPILFCIFFSIVAISIRKLTESEPTFTIALYFSLFAMIASLFTIPFGGWVLWPSSLFDLGVLILVGLSGGIGNIFLTMSYRNAEVSIVTPLKYLALVFAIIFGYLFWGEIPTFKTLIGATLVIISSIIIFRREIYLKSLVSLSRHE